MANQRVHIQILVHIIYRRIEELYYSDYPCFQTQELAALHVEILLQECMNIHLLTWQHPIHSSCS